MYNLLQKHYDLQCELLERGYINYPVFEQLEKEYLKRIKLFTICMN